MLSRRSAKYVALLLLLGMLIPTGLALTKRGSNQGPSAAEQARQADRAQRQHCESIAKGVATQLQGYVDRFDTKPGSSDSTAPGVPSIPRLRAQVRDLTSRVGGEGCDVAVFRRALSRDLDAVHASTDLGGAIAATLVANMRDVLEPGAPRRVTLRAGDDLTRAFQALPSGSTLVLGPGTYHVGEPLVSLQDVTVTGAGSGRTRIVSTAPEAALLQPAPARLELAGLTLAHAGPRPASVLLLRAGSSSLQDVTVTGAVMRKDASRSRGAVPDLASGGNGIIAASRDRVTIVRSTVRDNEAAGVVTTGSSRLELRHSVVSRNGLCGACLLGRSSPVVAATTLRHNQIGVLVGGGARPTVTGDLVVDNARAGLVSQQRSAPRIVHNRVRSNGDIGVAVYNGSSATVRDNAVSGHRQVGVVVSTTQQASPTVTDNTLQANAQAGVAFLGTSRGAVGGNACSGGVAGLVLGGSAQPTLSGTAGCPVHDERTG